MAKTYNIKDYFTAIDVLRLPLTIAVVMLHTYMFKPSGTNSLFPISYFFSLMFGELGVPTFFFISGFLFFRNRQLSAEEYKRKLKSRATSLLIPYLLWNTLLIFFYAVVQSIPSFATYFSGSNKPIADYSFADFLLCFWDKGEGLLANGTPILQPMWYIRNLIVFTCCAPIFFYVNKHKLSYVVLPTLGIWWFMTPGIAFTQSSLFFFMLGSAASMLRWRFIGISAMWIIPLCLCFGIADYGSHFFWPIPYSIILHRSFLLSSIFAAFNIAAFAGGRAGGKIGNAQDYSFFLYACHYPIIILLCKLASRHVCTESIVIQTSVYMGIILITIVTTYLLFYLMRVVCPKILRLLTGAR